MRRNGHTNRRDFRGGVAFAASGVTPPTNTVAPVASGTVEIGNNLSVTDGTWTGSPSFTYQWQRDGVSISMATSSTYAVTSSDIGPVLRCIVTGTNAGGSTLASSNTLTFAHATYLPSTAIGTTAAGTTLADGNTTIDQWASSLGGVSCTLAASAPTNRPTWNATTGATFDGVDNHLVGTLTKGSAFATYEMGFVGERVVTGAASDLALGYAPSGTINFSLQDTNALALRWSVSGGANLTSTTDPDGLLTHWSGDGESGTLNLRIAGSVHVTTAATVTSRADGGSLCAGGRADGTASGNYIIRAWYCGPALTSTQRTHIRALLTYHTGVSC